MVDNLKCSTIENVVEQAYADARELAGDYVVRHRSIRQAVCELCVLTEKEIKVDGDGHI